MERKHDGRWQNGNTDRGDAATFEFRRGDDGLWRWRRVGSQGHQFGEESRGFPTHADCVADAVHHGYMEGAA